MRPLLSLALGLCALSTVTASPARAQASHDAYRRDVVALDLTTVGLGAASTASGVALLMDHREELRGAGAVLLAIGGLELLTGTALLARVPRLRRRGDAMRGSVDAVVAEGQRMHRMQRSTRVWRFASTGILLTGIAGLIVGEQMREPWVTGISLGGLF